MPDLTDTDLALLNLAAALFDGVAHADSGCLPDVQLSCMAAAEDLRHAGADPDPLLIDTTEPDTAIRQALHALSGLPPAVFARRRILDASYSGQTALRAL